MRDYNKAATSDLNRQAIAILRDLDISRHASLMVNPDFTEADFMMVRRSISLVGPAEMSFTVFSPPPGTELWKKHRTEFCCPDPYGFDDGLHILLPARMPLKKFYRQFSMLWLCAARHSPLVRQKLKVPLKDWFRFFYSGFWHGCSIQLIFMDYNRRLVKQR